MDTSITLGIDLGTTNSVVAVYQGGDVTVLENESGSRITPSVVRFPPPEEERTEPYVGQAALNAAQQYPDRTIRSIKRKMGADWATEVDGKEYTPVDISAYILRSLKESAAKALGCDTSELTDVVVTVPAYFTEDQRQATKAAAQMAEFEAVELLNEPTAAAIADGYHNPSDPQTVLVYDLGGGTFDVSVLDIGGGSSTFRVKATGGNRELGGDDWDQRIVDWAADHIQTEQQLDPLESHPHDEPGGRRQRLVRLEEAAQEAKHEVCIHTQTAQLNLPFFMQQPDGPIADVSLTLDHTTFQTLTQDLTEQTVTPVRDAIEQAGYTVPDIDDVVLVGGATRMPQVQSKLGDITGQEVGFPTDPDLAVAKGAAIHGNDDAVLLQDVTPLSLGIGTDGGRFESIIPRNSSLPVEESKIFTTSRPNQSQARIDIYQGESDLTEQNHYLTTFFLTGIGPAAPGIPQIEVSFRVDANGIITARAEAVGGLSDEAQSEVRIDSAPEITEQEIQQHIQTVKQQQEQTDKQIKLIEQRSQLERNHQWALRILSEHTSVVDESDQEAIAELAAQAEELLDRDITTISELEQCNDRLSSKLTSVGSEAMTRNQAPDTESTEANSTRDDTQYGWDPAQRFFRQRESQSTHQSGDSPDNTQRQTAQSSQAPSNITDAQTAADINSQGQSPLSPGEHSHQSRSPVPEQQDDTTPATGRSAEAVGDDGPSSNSTQSPTQGTEVSHYSQTDQTDGSNDNQQSDKSPVEQAPTGEQSKRDFGGTSEAPTGGKSTLSDTATDTETTVETGPDAQEATDAAVNAATGAAPEMGTDTNVDSEANTETEPKAESESEPAPEAEAEAEAEPAPEAEAETKPERDQDSEISGGTETHSPSQGSQQQSSEDSSNVELKSSEDSSSGLNVAGEYTTGTSPEQTQQTTNPDLTEDSNSTQDSEVTEVSDGGVDTAQSRTAQPTSSDLKIECVDPNADKHDPESEDDQTS